MSFPRSCGAVPRTPSGSVLPRHAAPGPPRLGQASHWLAMPHPHTNTDFTHKKTKFANCSFFMKLLSKLATLLPLAKLHENVILRQFKAPLTRKRLTARPVSFLEPDRLRCSVAAGTGTAGCAGAVTVSGAALKSGSACTRSRLFRSVAASVSSAVLLGNELHALLHSRSPRDVLSERR